MLTAVAALRRAARPRLSPRPGRGRRADAVPPMPVEVATAAHDTVVDAILASGQIEAIQSIELRPDIEGRLAQILVREGTVGREGRPALQGGRRRVDGAGGAGRGRSRPGRPGARAHPRPDGTACLVAGRPRARGSHGAEHPGASTISWRSAWPEPPCAPRSPAWSGSGS